MIRNANAKNTKRRENSSPIRTSLLELLQALNGLTKNDALVIAAVKSIFGSHRVRLTYAPIPVRLEGAAGSHSRKQRHRG